MAGAGAAGVAVARLLMDAGVASIVACDRYGSIHAGRSDYESGEMNAPKTWLAEHTNPDRRETTLGGALEGTRRLHRPVRAGRDLGRRRARR